MKKNLFAFALILLTGIISSQTVNISRSRAQLLQAKLISDILPGLPVGDSLPTQLTGKCKGNLVQFKMNTNVISEEFKEFFKNADKNTKMYFDILYVVGGSKQKEFTSKTYVVKVTE